MNNSNLSRLAWLVPSAETGAYFGPIVRKCSQGFHQTLFYTGQVWPGFDPKDIAPAEMKITGKTKFVETDQAKEGYSRGFIYASPGIVKYLVEFRPHIIVAWGLSVWTLIALLLKGFYQWKVIVVFDGISPNTSFQNSKIRLLIRRFMTKFIDAFIANSNAASLYIRNTLKASEKSVFHYPYLVPDPQPLSAGFEKVEAIKKLNSPVFLYVGSVIPRKGLNELLKACFLLQAQGCFDYTLVIVGDGAQREELERVAKEKNLQGQIIWAGWLKYEQLGAYFQSADVFIFPSLEDTWGMGVLEAMAFGKPVLCSKWAGSVEMVLDGENGFIFDPHDPATLAALMRHLIDQPELIDRMGGNAYQLMQQYTPSYAMNHFAKVVDFVVKE